MRETRFERACVVVTSIVMVPCYVLALFWDWNRKREGRVPRDW
jgi:hypothetical protein